MAAPPVTRVTRNFPNFFYRAVDPDKFAYASYGWCHYLEAEAAAALLDHAGADVGGHHDEGVLEVHGATLGVRKTAVLENLQQHIAQ
eukprot:803695-Pyramimonas_sp.AAC.1